jgi:hypothetical protein
MNSKESDLRKFLNKKFDQEAVKKKLSSYTNAANQPLFHSDKHFEVKVKIKPDKSIAPALFKPDLENPGHYKAHPQTINAMRKDLFMGGEDFIDLEVKVDCDSCHKTLDLQFWKHCPFCEGKLRLRE